MSALATFAMRYLLVSLFFPFSALDKIINFEGAVKQAETLLPDPVPAKGMILTGLFVEVAMPVAILTGVADRAAALVMAGYCGATGVLFKQFWRPGDFWHAGDSKGRDLFWDCMKNFSLAGGFLLLAFGGKDFTVRDFIADPLASSQPYRRLRS